MLCCSLDPPGGGRERSVSFPHPLALWSPTLPLPFDAEKITPSGEALILSSSENLTNLMPFFFFFGDLLRLLPRRPPCQIGKGGDVGRFLLEMSVGAAPATRQKPGGGLEEGWLRRGLEDSDSKRTPPPGTGASLGGREQAGSSRKEKLESRDPALAAGLPSVG